MPKAKAEPTQPQPGLQMLPLNALDMSPMNTRQIIDPAEIEAMVHSIYAVGLLQNLVGFQSAGSPKVQIVGGGKRLQALQWLAAHNWAPLGQMPCVPIDPVPVRITDDLDLAIAWSGAENTARSPLHPADEIQAFDAMRRQGAGVDMIARTFAVTGAHVRGRLALADLPTTALAALRLGQISLDVAKALTLGRDIPEHQEQVLEAAIRQNLSARNVEYALKKEGVASDDRRVKFVGLDALEAAGVFIHRDLFSDQAFITDAARLDALFEEKGIDLAQRMAADDGWLWGKFHTGYASDVQGKGMTQVYEKLRDLPTGDRERLAALNALDHPTQEDIDELRRLNARRRYYDDADKSIGGIVVTVNYNGAPQISAFIRAEDQDKATGAAGDGTASLTPAAKPMSALLVEDLARVKLLALQTALLDQTTLMLDLLTFQLVSNLNPWQNVLALTATPPPITPEKPDGTHVAKRLAALYQHGVTTSAPLDEFAVFRAATTSGERTVMLGAALARLVQRQGDLANGIGTMMGIDTRKVWSPTASGYFSRLSGAALDAIYAELVPASVADHKQFCASKVAAKAKTLQALFDDMSIREALGLNRAECARIDSWLPPELRWPQPQPEDEEAAA